MDSSKYQIISKIGSGPLADVHLCRVDGINRQRALKQLNAESQNSQYWRRTFFAEASEWAGLASANLATIHDLEKKSGFIVMELYPNSGASILSRGALPAGSAKSLLESSLRGLDQIHRCGFLHGNIKPSNILIRDSGDAALSDGRCLKTQDLQQVPRKRGESKYLAPEYCAEKIEQIGASTDLYCLGIVMLELMLGGRFDAEVLGKSFLDNNTDIDTAWFRWHASRNAIKPIEDLLPSVQTGLGNVLGRLICKDPTSRYHSAAEAIADLQRTNVAQTIAAPVPDSAPQREFQIMPDRVVNRPATPVVVRLLSGTRAGGMIGISENAFSVSDTDDVDVSPGEEIVDIDRTMLRIRKEVEGWTLHTSGLARTWIDKRKAGPRESLKSGDIVRVGDRGPDFQFLVQSASSDSLISIIEKHAPTLLANQPSAADAPAPPARPSPASRGAARGTSPVAPASPTAPSASEPSPESSPDPSPVAPNFDSTPLSENLASEPPAVTPKASAATEEPDSVAPLPPGQKASRTQMNSSKRNWIVLAVSIVLLGGLIALVPSAEDSKEPPAGEKAPSTISDEASPSATPPTESSDQDG